jgi:hypothetical protein
LQKARFGVFRLTLKQKADLSVFGLDDGVFGQEQGVFGPDGIDMNLQHRRQFRFTRSRPLQLLPQHPRTLHAFNRLRLRLHVQPKQLRLIQRSISRLAHATALHRAHRTRLLLQPDLRLALPNTTLNIHHWSQGFGHGC